ncbi:unnamed protein product [Rotaria sordida]|uniref:Uncharacterized protein n=2 Tax=Rotaria sordida TaxID=392033 RepID=A0A815MUJ5_9BILA|nr:unnamed protein product [Rotaria sordida]
MDDTNDYEDKENKITTDFGSGGKFLYTSIFIENSPTASEKRENVTRKMYTNDMIEIGAARHNEEKLLSSSPKASPLIQQQQSSSSRSSSVLGQ